MRRKVKKVRKQSRVKRINKTTRIRIITAVVACLLVAGVSFTVYSKYYKTGYNPGMATASGFYFSSNYLSAVESIMGKSMAEIARDYQKDILVSTNDNSWRGENGYSFPIEIRNYDNNLLYNDKDLNVEYEVSFMLLEDPSGIATYTVARDGESKTLGWSNGQGTVATFTGRLDGGKLSADGYQLNVSMVNAERYVPTGVLIVARPTGPSYLAKTKWIASIMKVNYEEKEFRIEKAGFKISDNDTWQDDVQKDEGDEEHGKDEERINQWKKDVEKESGYVYQLYTTGNNTGTGTRKTLELRWREDLFKINNFDTYYSEVKGQADRYYTEEKDGYTWQVMKIDVLPYASLKFVFFRKDETFMNKVNKMEINDFKDTVRVTIVK